VLNPYCDLNKAIANRASHHHPIWKRWAKKTKNQDTLKKKKQVPIHNSWILLLLLTQEKRRWYMTYSIYISLFMCLSPVFGNKQTLPHLYIYKYVCIILYIIIVEYPHHPPLQKHFCRSVNESSYFSFFFKFQGENGSRFFRKDSKTKHTKVSSIQSLNYLSWIIVFVISPPKLSSNWCWTQDGRMAALQSPLNFEVPHTLPPPLFKWCTQNKDFNPLIFNFSNFGDQNWKKSWIETKQAHGEEEKQTNATPPQFFIPTWPVDRHPPMSDMKNSGLNNYSKKLKRKSTNFKYDERFFFFFVKRKQNKQKNGSVYFFAWSVFLIIIHFWLAGVFKYLLNGSAMCFFHGSGFGIFISGFLWIEWPPPLSSHSIIPFSSLEIDCVCDPVDISFIVQYLPFY
jgi:hypothetical protein